MTSEKFCLRWNDFESHISGSLKDIRDARDFFDVTLVCEEEQLQAHKVIISACSPFFRNILQRNPHQHPLVYLKVFYYAWEGHGFLFEWKCWPKYNPKSKTWIKWGYSPSNITPPYCYWSQCWLYFPFLKCYSTILWNLFVYLSCLLKLFPNSLTNQIQENR